MRKHECSRVGRLWREVVAVIVSALTLSVKADLLITASNALNQIAVPSNQVLVISAIRPAFSFSGANANPLVETIKTDSSFTTNTSLLPCVVPITFSQPLALAGPATLVLPVTSAPGDNFATGPLLVSYQLIQSSAIKTVFLPPAMNSSSNQFTFSIPTGKKAHLFTPFTALPTGVSDGQHGGFVNVSNLTQTIQVPIQGGEELSGPASVTVMNINDTSGNPYSDHWQIYSYYLTDNFTAPPAVGYLQGGTGGFQVAIEKSPDLTNWSQVIYYPTSTDQKAFYRMRIGN